MKHPQPDQPEQEQEVLITRSDESSYGSLAGLNIQGESGTAFTLISPVRATQEIIRSAIPMGLSYTFSLSIVALVILMGHLGNDQERINYLDASPLLAALLDTLDIVAISSLFSIGIVTSNKRGQLLKRYEDQNLEEEGADDEPHQRIIEKRQEISDLFKNSLALTAISIPLPMTVLFFSEELFRSFGQREIVAELVGSYAKRYAIAFPPLIFRMCFEQTMFGFNKQVPAMVIGLVNLTLGTLLAALLGFNGYGLPGIAYGFITEAYLTCLGYGLYLGFNKEFTEFNFFRNFKFSIEDLSQIKELLRIGAPMTLTIVSEVAASFFMSVFAGWLGSDALAAWDFASWLSFFTVIMSASTAQVTSQRVSAALGEKKYVDANRYALYGLPANLLLTVPICILLAAVPQLLAELIANGRIDDSVMGTIRPLLGLMVPIVAADGIRHTMIQTALAVKDNVISPAISTAGICFGVLLAYVLGVETDLGIYGVATGYGIGILTGVIGMLPRWKNNINPERLSGIEETVVVDHPSFWNTLTGWMCGSEYEPLSEHGMELQQSS